MENACYRKNDAGISMNMYPRMPNCCTLRTYMGYEGADKHCDKGDEQC
jgi:hypothetical protein